MKTYQLDTLNHLATTDPIGWVAQCEHDYQTQIDTVADAIALRQQTKPIVLLNGASSAGKTTTADRLVAALQAKGMRAQRLSMDDYYVDRNASMPFDEENNVPDWESPLCMNLQLLSDHLNALAQGREILLPHYDFQVGKQHLNVTPMQLEADEVAIVEGIHAFNPVITGTLARFATGAWLSPDAQVVDDTHTYPSELLRFLRRAVRDANFRGAPVSKTIGQWKSVRRGERLYINPYTSHAELTINTYLPYETGILCAILQEDLQKNALALAQIGLLDALAAAENFTAVTYAGVMPENSLLREFVGHKHH